MLQELTKKKVKLNDNSVLIKKFIKGIEGGRALDVTGWDNDVIQCGHIIISKTDEKGKKTYAPLGVEGGAYKALADGEKYEGLLVSSLVKTFAAAAIMTWGIVNEEVVPYAIPSAFKEALPHIDFQVDEEA